jgi:hypothetical protein
VGVLAGVIVYCTCVFVSIVWKLTETKVNFPKQHLFKSAQTESMSWESRINNDKDRVYEYHTWSVHNNVYSLTNANSNSLKYKEHEEFILYDYNQIYSQFL